MRRLIPYILSFSLGGAISGRALAEQPDCSSFLTQNPHTIQDPKRLAELIEQLGEAGSSITELTDNHELNIKLPRLAMNLQRSLLQGRGMVPRFHESYELSPLHYHYLNILLLSRLKNGQSVYFQYFNPRKVEELKILFTMDGETLKQTPEVLVFWVIDFSNAQFPVDNRLMQVIDLLAKDEGHKYFFVKDSWKNEPLEWQSFVQNSVDAVIADYPRFELELDNTYRVWLDDIGKMITREILLLPNKHLEPSRINLPHRSIANRGKYFSVGMEALKQGMFFMWSSQVLAIAMNHPNMSEWDREKLANLPLVMKENLNDWGVAGVPFEVAAYIGVLKKEAEAHSVFPYVKPSSLFGEVVEPYLKVTNYNRNVDSNFMREAIGFWIGRHRAYLMHDDTIDPAAFSKWVSYIDWTKHLSFMDPDED